MIDKIIVYLWFFMSIMLIVAAAEKTSCLNLYYEYENYKKYNEEGNTVAANRALGKSYAFEAIYTYIKNM